MKAWCTYHGRYSVIDGCGYCREAYRRLSERFEAFARHIGFQIDEFVLCCGEESRIGDACPVCDSVVHRFDYGCLCTPCERVRHEVRVFCAPASARRTLERLPVITDSPAMREFAQVMEEAWG